MKKIFLSMMLVLGIISTAFSQGLITDVVEGSYYLTTPEAVSFATISFLPDKQITDAIRYTIETKNPGSKLTITGTVQIVSMAPGHEVTEATYSVFSFNSTHLLSLGQTVYYSMPVHEDGVEYMLVNVNDKSVLFLTNIVGYGRQ